MKIDLKTFMTGCVIVTMCVSMLAVVVSDVIGRVDMQITDSITTLFTNACTAVITYYFTRKSATSMHSKDKEESDAENTSETV